MRVQELIRLLQTRNPEAEIFGVDNLRLQEMVSLLDASVPLPELVVPEKPSRRRHLTPRTRALIGAMRGDAQTIAARHGVSVSHVHALRAKHKKAKSDGGK